MIKYFISAFKISSDNIILTTPLILFVILISAYTSIVHNLPQTIPAVILFASTCLFMIAAFISGWLFMIKKAVDLESMKFDSNEEKAKASLSLLNDFPRGVGEYFLPFVFGLILYSLLFLGTCILIYNVGLHLIGRLDISLQSFKLALESSDAMKHFITGLSKKDLLMLNSWYLLILGAMILYSFITMFWSSEIIIGSKNSFIAFFKALKFSFKNFLGAIIVFLYVNFVNFMVSIVMNLLVILPIKIKFLSFLLSLVSMMLYFYFFVYVVVLVFLYYARENNRGNKEQVSDSIQVIEQTQDNSDSGSDSFGQEQSGDSDSQRD